MRNATEHRFTVAFESVMAERLCTPPWTWSKKEKGVQHVVGHDKELKDMPPVGLFFTHHGLKDRGRVYFLPKELMLNKHLKNNVASSPRVDLHWRKWRGKITFDIC